MKVDASRLKGAKTCQAASNGNSTRVHLRLPHTPVLALMSHKWLHTPDCKEKNENEMKQGYTHTSADLVATSGLEPL